MAYYSANLKFLGDAVKNTKQPLQFDGKTNLDTEQTGVTSGLAYQTLDAGVAKAYGVRFQGSGTGASAAKAVFYSDYSYGLSQIAAQNYAGLGV